MSRVIINECGEFFNNAVVAEIHQVLQRTSTEGTNISVGLSGGSMPAQISPGLLKLKDVDWSLVHFFFCDERVVPFDSPESTYGVYKKLLFDRLGASLPPANVHKIHLDESTELVAEAYQTDILNYFGGADKGFPAFDLLLLGLGPDGHTCSLFPEHPLLSIEDRVVSPISDSPKPPPTRVTLTLPIINKAKQVVFVVSGADKAAVVCKIIEGSPTPLLPASLVNPIECRPTWCLDRPAAHNLKSAN